MLRQRHLSICLQGESKELEASMMSTRLTSDEIGFPDMLQDLLRGNSVQSVSIGPQFRLWLPTNRRFISPAVRMVREFYRSCEWLPELEQDRLRVPLEEALTNAMVHGNLEVSSELRDLEDESFHRLITLRTGKAPYKNRRVEVSARYTAYEATFTISDEGRGFDVSGIPDPTDKNRTCCTHGRGLFLMRAFMDDVRFNAVGNSVTLIKRRQVGDSSKSASAVDHA